MNEISSSSFNILIIMFSSKNWRNTSLYRFNNNNNLNNSNNNNNNNNNHHHHHTILYLTHLAIMKEKEMFYFTPYSAYFSYCYIQSSLWLRTTRIM